MCWRSVFLATLCLGMSACGGKSTEGTCSDVCAKNQRCRDGGVVDTDCVPSCISMANRVRPEVFQVYASCVLGLACGVSTDSCLQAAYVRVSGSTRAIDTDFQAACEGARGACPGTLTDDDCRKSVLYLETYVTQAKACLSRPCAEIQGCVRGFLGN